MRERAAENVPATTNALSRSSVVPDEKGVPAAIRRAQGLRRVDGHARLSPRHAGPGEPFSTPSGGRETPPSAVSTRTLSDVTRPGLTPSDPQPEHNYPATRDDLVSRASRRVHRGSTRPKTSGSTRPTDLSLSRAFCRDFFGACARAELALHGGARLIIVRSVVRIHPELSNSAAECSFCSRRAAIRRDPLCREVVDRPLPALQSAIRRSCVHESPIGRPPRVHNRSPLAATRGLCRPLAGEDCRKSRKAPL
jgi:hypothetical protein